LTWGTGKYFTVIYRFLTYTVTNPAAAKVAGAVMSLLITLGCARSLYRLCNVCISATSFFKSVFMRKHSIIRCIHSYRRNRSYTEKGNTAFYHVIFLMLHYHYSNPPQGVSVVAFARLEFGLHQCQNQIQPLHQSRQTAIFIFDNNAREQLYFLFRSFSV
jgi:hypothetical protein